MKKVFLSALLSFFFSTVSAQPAWTWLQGDAFTPIYGRYGTKGVSDTANRPGRRTGYATWKDASGDIWLFGGEGYSSTGYGYLNDLWKYSPATDSWTWVSGDYVYDQAGRYGTKGLSSPNNIIRSRANAVSWMDAAGNLWLFGGQTFRTPLAATSFYTDDLWKFTPSTQLWTWMGGDTAYYSVSYYRNVYGTRGIAAAANKPGSRYKATGWTDNAGDLWMFGGFGVAAGTSLGGLNDLWKYSPATGLWTWMKGDTLPNQKGSYETKGVASATTRPGAKQDATSWTDAAGNCWLFSGGDADDVWSFSSTTDLWTWISGDSTAATAGRYGILGVSSPNNTPGSRNGAVGWMNGTTDFLLYGGIKGYVSNPLSDLWKFSTVTREWTWLGGDTATGTRPAVYGLKGIPSDSTKPGSFTFGSGWMDGTNQLWLSISDVLWDYSLTTGQWTWIKGDTSTVNPSLITYAGSYGIKGIPSASNQPKPRRFATTWTDTANLFWMYGGSISPASDYSPNSYSGFLNDLWKYDPSAGQWTWVQGDTLLDQPPVYGTQGISSAANTPGARHMAASWKDDDGSLWLFGGYYFNHLTLEKRYADLWKYSPSTGQWTWINNVKEGPGLYGSKGVATANTHPGARYAATTWKDAAGNLWLFGGFAYGGNVLYYSNGRLNDLWKYTPSSNRWTWISGDTAAATYSFPNNGSQRGVYGTKGVAAASNKPGGRSGASGWTDGQGNLWLFGGTTDVDYGSETREQYLNDLWKYEPVTGLWTWVNGDNDNPARSLLIPKSVYGVKGLPAAANTPGGRKYAITWKDAVGSVYLFGGNLDSISPRGNLLKYLNDFWKYTIADNQWTWLGGDTNTNRRGIYGTPGQPSALNQPGARDGSMGWGDNKGSLWLYGGFGQPANGVRFLNDIMKFSLSAALPVLFSSFHAQKQSETVALYWSTAQEQNSRSFIVERSSDGFVFGGIGTVAAAGNRSTPSSYSFIDITPLQGDNYYRLKEVDLDNKFMYSSVAKVSFGEKEAGFTILSNPAQHEMGISLWLSLEQKVQLQVRDAGGRVLMTRSFTANKGTNLFRLPVGSLSKGTYFVQVQSLHVNGTKPFVKQ